MRTFLCCILIALLPVTGKAQSLLVLGGEVGNSSASSLAYMAPIWSKAKAMHMNTLLLPVYWELMEPAEGKFDFMLVDSLIYQARSHDLHVIFLWFGSWKNSMSCYAPAWVKKNGTRFPCALPEIMSAFEENNLRADAKAFRALMQHIKQVDGKQKTVIMIQVENEIGLLGAAREHTPAANKAFEAPVPPALIDYLISHKDSLVPELRKHWAQQGYKTTGNWETIFGKSPATDELFQAWYYAVYTNKVALAGREVYDLPFFVNAALNYRHVQPGAYPSGGPLPHLMDIWQAGAPAIDILSPDFYNPFFKEYCEAYTRQHNRLFIPEIRFEPTVAVKALYAVGHYNASGFSPFSFESTDNPSAEPLGKSYALLQRLAPFLHLPKEGMLPDSSIPQEIRLGDYTFTIAHEATLGWTSFKEWPLSGAIIIQTAPDDFIIAGTGIVLTVKDHGILSAEEGTFSNSKWLPVRRLNGDQTHQGRHIRIPSGSWEIQQVKFYNY